MDYILAVWLTEAASRRNSAVRAAYLWELDSAFKRHGVVNALPRSEIRFSRAGARSFEDTFEVQDVASVNDAKEEAQMAAEEAQSRT